MDIKKYIASGILELYVSGALGPEENIVVQQHAIEHPEIQKEIEAIEIALLELTAAVSPGLKKDSFKRINSEINDVNTLTADSSLKRTSWNSYLGWAASLILAAGMLWMFLQNDNLKKQIQLTQEEQESLKKQIQTNEKLLKDKSETKQLLNEIRDKDVSVIAMAGQNISPESYAKIYWNKTKQKVFVDVKGLPKPPEGFTYQVWSLKLSPLTPTSIGLLDDFTNNDKEVFVLPNYNESEAFGITLEPEGGSESPNLEQLYTLGSVGP